MCFTKPSALFCWILGVQFLISCESFFLFTERLKSFVTGVNCVRHVQEFWIICKQIVTSARLFGRGWRSFQKRIFSRLMWWRPRRDYERAGASLFSLWAERSWELEREAGPQDCKILFKIRQDKDKSRIAPLSLSPSCRSWEIDGASDLLPEQP